MVAVVRDVDVAAGVDRNVPRVIEFAVAVAGRPESEDAGPAGVELLDPVVAGVGDVDGAGAVDRDAFRSGEVAAGTEHRRYRARAVEFEDLVRACVGDVHGAGAVDRDVVRGLQRVSRRSDASDLRLVYTRGAVPLDPAGAGGVGHEDVTAAVDGDPERPGESARPGRRPGDLRLVLARRVELLHARVGAVGDVDVAGGVRGDADGGQELAVA